MEQDRETVASYEPDYRSPTTRARLRKPDYGSPNTGARLSSSHCDVVRAGEPSMRRNATIGARFLEWSICLHHRYRKVTEKSWTVSDEREGEGEVFDLHHPSFPSFFKRSQQQLVFSLGSTVSSKPEKEIPFVHVPFEWPSNQSWTHRASDPWLLYHRSFGNFKATPQVNASRSRDL